MSRSPQQQQPGNGDEDDDGKMNGLFEPPETRNGRRGWSFGVTTFCRQIYNKIQPLGCGFLTYHFVHLFVFTDTWSMTVASKRCLGAFDQWCLRYILHIRFTAHVTNQEVRSRTGQPPVSGSHFPRKVATAKALWPLPEQNWLKAMHTHRKLPSVVSRELAPPKRPSTPVLVTNSRS